MNKTIFIIDDDIKIQQTLSRLLKRENHEPVLFTYGLTALEVIKKKPPGLILLDLTLPDIDGMELCKMIKQNDSMKNIPIIMITGRDSDEEMVAGLTSGADDYLAKPFNDIVLMARIKALLRRVKYKGALEEIIELGNIKVNITRHEVEIDNGPVKLSGKEFDILCIFMENPGRVLSKYNIYESVWRCSRDINTRTVDTYIWSLRKKMGTKASKRIVTIQDRGYKLVD
jgi:DNA-binding response OmpR family regulator